MDIQTRVDCPRDDFRLSITDRLLIMGSCFAEHIGEKLTAHKFTCHTNPFGALYNPESIRRALSLMLDLREGKPYPTGLFFQGQEGLWHSRLHSTAFSAPTLEECKRRVAEPLARIVPGLAEVYTLIITFGTNQCYLLKSSGEIVGNCHRQPSSAYEETRLSVGQIVSSYTALLDRMFALNPSLRVLFTISPYRYFKKCGMHANQLNKATLLLAVNDIQSQYPGRCYYFPAYEIVLDELRDYRFYAEDMVHPSAQAVAYVTERFEEYALDEGTKAFLRDWIPVHRDLAHRPLHPESSEYRTFLENLREKLSELSKKYPNLAFQNEQTHVDQLLNPT